MTYRRALFLFLTALGLWSYLLIWELPSLTQEEKLDVLVSVLPQKKEQIISLEFVSPAKKLTLMNQEERWLVTAPSLDEAEEPTIEALLSQLELARASRIFTEEEPSFGIDQKSPSLQITFKDKTKLTLLVGADTVGGGLFYAFRSDTRQVLLLPSSLKVLLVQDLDLYRAQRAISVRRDEITSVALTSSAKTLRLRREGALWWQESPVKGRVDAAKAEALLRSIEALRVKEFVVPQRYTGAEERSLNVSTEEGEEKVTLRGPMEEGGARFYVAKRDESFFLMDASLVEGLFAQPEELRDQKVFSSLQGATELRFEEGGESLRMLRDERGWRSEPASEIDPREVELFTDELEKLLVRSFATEASAPATQPSGASLQITFSDKSAQRFVVEGAASDGFVWMTRDGERIEAPSAVASLLSPDVLRFKPKLLLQVLPSSVKGLRLQRDGGEVSLERRGSMWWQSSPLEAMADQRAVEGLLVAFEELRALRFLPKSEQTTIDKPLASIVITGQDGSTHMILFGEASKEKGRLVKIDSQDVCVLSEALWLSLGADWIERRVFISVALEGLVSVTLTQQAMRVSLRRVDGGWTGADGKKYSALLVNKLVQEIVDITADEVLAFDEKIAEQYGLATPSFEGELNEGDTTTTFIVGSIADEQGRVALRLQKSGPLYLLSEEEAKYLKLPVGE